MLHNFRERETYCHGWQSRLHNFRERETYCQGWQLMLHNFREGERERHTVRADSWCYIIWERERKRHTVRADSWGYIPSERKREWASLTVNAVNTQRSLWTKQASSKQKWGSDSLLKYTALCWNRARVRWLRINLEGRMIRKVDFPITRGAAERTFESPEQWGT